MPQTDCIVPSTFLCNAKSCQFLLSFEVSAAEQICERWRLGTKHVFKKLWLLDLSDIWESSHGIFERHLMVPHYEIKLTDTTGGCGKQTAGRLDPFGMATFQVPVAMYLGWFTPENEGLEIEIDGLQEPSLGRMGEVLSLPICKLEGKCIIPNIIA